MLDLIGTATKQMYRNFPVLGQQPCQDQLGDGRTGKDLDFV